ncbi:glycosyl hydrolase family 28-related protein [Streptomyces sp. NPDC002755]
MARHLFGGSPADYAAERVGSQLLLRPGAIGTVWTTRTGGTQLTDLTDVTGAPVTQITADGDGGVTFYGPNNITTCYLDFGYSRRYTMSATDLGDVLDDFKNQAGQPGGWLQLDEDGGIPSGMLRSSVDWVIATTAPYSATGDGATDDTAALQAAVEAAAAARTTLYIPAGTYMVSEPILLPAGEGYALAGSGWGTSLKLAAGANCFVLAMQGEDTRVIIRDMKIDGNCSGQSTTGSSGGIDGSGAVACRFDNIHFVACRDDAVYLAGMTGGAFGHNNRLIGCLFDGSMASTGPGRGIHANSNDENQIIGCDFEFLGGSGGTGYSTAVAILDRAGTQFISSCNFVGGATNQTKGVRIQDASSTKITGCNFDGTAGDSIFIAGTGNSIVGNTIFSPGEVGTAGQASGIHLEYAASRNLISGNTIVSSPTNGRTRSLIREEAMGPAGQNQITGNVLTVKGTCATAVTELAAPGTVFTSNLGAASTLTGEQPGCYARRDWGRFWKTARDAAKAGTGKASIAVVGGSATVGFYASNLVTKNWPALLAATLQTAYGDGGSGFTSSMLSANGIAGQDSAAITAWTTAGNLVTQSGTWTTGGYAAGPGWGYTYASTNGAYLTFAVRGSTVNIYTLGADGSRPTWAYSIDGGAETTVTDSATTGLAILKRTITGLSAGAHTVRVRHTGTGGQYLSVCGVGGENASGLILNNFGRKNATAADYNATLRAGWNGGPSYPADLVVYAVSVEDVTNGTSADDWAAQARQHLANIRDGGSLTGASDIAIVLPHIGAADLGWRYQDYVDRAHSLARGFDAALIDLWALGRNSWNYWNSLGYWGSSASPGTTGTDAVHLSDAGHTYTAAVINTLLQS